MAGNPGGGLPKLPVTRAAFHPSPPRGLSSQSIVPPTDNCGVLARSRCRLWHLLITSGLVLNSSFLQQFGIYAVDLPHNALQILEEHETRLYPVGPGHQRTNPLTQEIQG